MFFDETETFNEILDDNLFGNSGTNLKDSEKKDQVSNYSENPNKISRNGYVNENRNNELVMHEDNHNTGSPPMEKKVKLEHVYSYHENQIVSSSYNNNNNNNNNEKSHHIPLNSNNEADPIYKVPPPTELQSTGDASHAKNSNEQSQALPSAVPTITIRTIQQPVAILQQEQHQPPQKIVQPVSIHTFLKNGDEYSGFVDAEGFPSGQGKLIAHTSGDSYVGEFRKGQKNGLGVLSFASGGRYSGEFLMDKANGFGTFEFPIKSGDGSNSLLFGIHRGKFSKGFPHGHGEREFDNGDRYVGDFARGMMHGRGVYSFKRGDKYVGEFRYGMPNGYGVMYFKGGGRYVGQFRNSLFHGVGRMEFPNHDVYDGAFKDNKLWGKGKYSFCDGTVCEGQFEGKQMCGTFIIRTKSNETFIQKRVKKGNISSIALKQEESERFRLLPRSKTSTKTKRRSDGTSQLPIAIVSHIDCLGFMVYSEQEQEMHEVVHIHHGLAEYRGKFLETRSILDATNSSSSILLEFLEPLELFSEREIEDKQEELKTSPWSLAMNTSQDCIIRAIDIISQEEEDDNDGRGDNNTYFQRRYCTSIAHVLPVDEVVRFSKKRWLEKLSDETNSEFMVLSFGYKQVMNDENDFDKEFISTIGLQRYLRMNVKQNFRDSAVDVLSNMFTMKPKIVLILLRNVEDLSWCTKSDMKWFGKELLRVQTHFVSVNLGFPIPLLLNFLQGLSS